jgi:hypothetical protein
LCFYGLSALLKNRASRGDQALRGYFKRAAHSAFGGIALSKAARTVAVKEKLSVAKSINGQTGSRVHGPTNQSFL